MSKKSRIIVRIMVLFLVMFALWPDRMTVHAEETPVLLVSGYAIADENGEQTQIVRGGQFTLTIFVTNHSSTVDAENVYVQMFYPRGVIPEFGTVSQQYIGTVKAAETVQITSIFEVDTAYEAEVVDFSIDVVYGERVQTAYVSIPCGSDSPFVILDAIVPEIVSKGESVDTSVTFKVLSEDNISNVSVDIAYNGTYLNGSYVGILTPGVTKTQKVSLSFPDVGEYPIEIYLVYTDVSGQKKAVLAKTASITVSENAGISSGSSQYGDITGTEDNDGINKLMIMGVAGVLILLFSFIVVYILVKRRR